ncbi:MAG: sulfotransferase [Nocardioides sp.]
MSTPSTRVLYVGGTGRSGSTVLANVLGQIPGLVSVGEVRFLWERGIEQDRLCGCGRHFTDCPFWTEVLTRALGPGDHEAVAARMQAALAERTRMRGLPGLLVRRGERPATDEVGDLLGRVYDAIADVSGAGVVVDSSKLPTYAALLGDVSTVDLQVLHLVRDPRAAAHSWRRRKHQPDLGSSAMMERRGAVKSAVLWRVWNGALERLCRERGIDHRLQNYESFVADPRNETRRLLRRFDLVAPERVDDLLDAVFAGPGVVRLDGNHTVAGNPSRHEHGLVALVPDEEWRSRLGTADRRAVSALTWPTLRHYGYRVRA